MAAEWLTTEDVVAAIGGGCGGYMCEDAGCPPEKRHARSEDGEPEKTRHAANGTSRRRDRAC